MTLVVDRRILHHYQQIIYLFEVYSIRNSQEHILAEIRIYVVFLLKNIIIHCCSQICHFCYFLKQRLYNSTVFSFYFYVILVHAPYYNQQATMSTFDNFKKSQHSQKSNKSNSQLSFKSFQLQPPNLANLSFSTSEIVFYMNDAKDILTNQELRVSNRTGTRLYFQITVNRPEYFDIRPRQDILEIGAVTNIVFRLLKKKVINDGDHRASPSEKVKSFLKNNAVIFSWGLITEQNIKYNQIPRTHNQQTLKLRVEGVESRIIEREASPRNGSLTKTYNQDMGMRENRVMSDAKGFDSTSRVILQSQEGEYSSLLTIPIIALVAFCSFVVGFVSA